MDVCVFCMWLSVGVYVHVWVCTSLDCCFVTERGNDIKQSRQVHQINIGCDCSMLRFFVFTCDSLVVVVFLVYTHFSFLFFLLLACLLARSFVRSFVCLLAFNLSFLVFIYVSFSAKGTFLIHQSITNLVIWILNFFFTQKNFVHISCLMSIRCSFCSSLRISK